MSEANGQKARTSLVLKFLQRPSVRILGLTLGALCIMGYHPFVDDAAIYVAGVEKIVSPALFQQHAEYILPHLQHSLFSVGMGWLIRLTRAPLLPALFVTYVFSLWLTVLACWRVSCQLFLRNESRWGATALLAATMTLPVAGSALTFMDPYLTARSFSTPIILFALVFALERKPVRTVLSLLLAVLLHPLMGGYAVVYIAVLWLLRDGRWKLLGGLTLAVFAGTLLATHAPALQQVSAGYRAATLSRSYFFLNSWKWYEVFGLFPPLLAAWIGCTLHPFNLHRKSSILCATSLYVGVSALLYSILFVHVSGPLMLASLQPLRAYHLIYMIFILTLGSLLGRYILQRRVWAWALCFAAIGIAMLAVQLGTYPDLAHIEWPGVAPHNPWEQAFLWIRANTPDNALFALDPRYQALPEESTVGFRAMTERSALPDWSKDGGIAAIYPKIAPEWFANATMETHWNQWSDAQRLQALAPYHVNWVVLSAATPTALVCPYQNAQVRVCQLPAETASLTVNP